jgi:hypothetical protein
VRDFGKGFGKSFSHVQKIHRVFNISGSNWCEIPGNIFQEMSGWDHVDGHMKFVVLLT